MSFECNVCLLHDCYRKIFQKLFEGNSEDFYLREFLAEDLLFFISEGLVKD